MIRIVIKSQLVKQMFLSKCLRGNILFKICLSESKKWVVSSHDLTLLRMWLLWLLHLVDKHEAVLPIYERLQIISSIL